jgi:ubiquinone/menaquinone biosynthesis C-methylase UbiE
MDPMAKHWNTIYSAKRPNEVSWTQEVPLTSLELIHNFNLPLTARIIDVGGGESKLVDCLLDEGYQNITVLDISEAALKKVKSRLGKRAEQVKWIVADVTEFKPEETYDLWHDRATFHFLVNAAQIEQYLSVAKKAGVQYLTIGTFSENGPTKCSGLEIKQYSEEQLQTQLSRSFEKLKCITEDHITPFHTKQNFLFCSFKRKVA